MLNSTALKSPAFLVRIKAAAIEAVKNSHAPNSRSHGIGQAVACNRKGRPAVLAAYHRRGGLEFFDMNDRDITTDVLAALRAYHREAAKPTATTRQPVALAIVEDGRQSLPYDRVAMVSARPKIQL